MSGNPASSHRSIDRKPDRPVGSRDNNPPVRASLSLVIDSKGKPQNVRALRPGRKSYVELAISAVRNWRFKPATCKGDPIQVQINVEVGLDVRG